jgi:hypothetical protein
VFGNKGEGCRFGKQQAVRSRESSSDSVVLVQNFTTKCPQSCMPVTSYRVITKTRTRVEKLKAIIRGKDGSRGSCGKKA